MRVFFGEVFFDGVYFFIFDDGGFTEIMYKIQYPVCHQYFGALRVIDTYKYIGFEQRVFDHFFPVAPLPFYFLQGAPAFHAFPDQYTVDLFFPPWFSVQGIPLFLCLHPYDTVKLRKYAKSMRNTPSDMRLQPPDG